MVDKRNPRRLFAGCQGHEQDPLARTARKCTQPATRDSKRGRCHERQRHCCCCQFKRVARRSRGIQTKRNSHKHTTKEASPSPPAKSIDRRKRCRYCCSCPRVNPLVPEYIFLLVLHGIILPGGNHCRVHITAHGTTYSTTDEHPAKQPTVHIHGF